MEALLKLFGRFVEAQERQASALEKLAEREIYTNFTAVEGVELGNATTAVKEVVQDPKTTTAQSQESPSVQEAKTTTEQSKPAEESKPVETEVAPDKSVEEAKSPKAPTTDDARAALRKFSQLEGTDAAIAMLERFNAKAVSDLTDVTRAELIAAIESGI